MYYSRTHRFFLVVVQCFDADVESLRLVASLADRAPMPLWRNAQALPNLLSTATRALQNNNSAAAAMEAVCEAVVYVGIAAQAATSGTSQTPSILLGARVSSVCFTSTKEIHDDVIILTFVLC